MDSHAERQLVSSERREQSVRQLVSSGSSWVGGLLTCTVVQKELCSHGEKKTQPDDNLVHAMHKVVARLCSLWRLGTHCLKLLQCTSILGL